MSNFFMAGADLVRWDLTTVRSDGRCCLRMHHATGSIVEYFNDATEALLRVGELESLLIAARTGERPGSAPPSIVFNQATDRLNRVS
jgi:hypothetical protein